MEREVLSGIEQASKLIDPEGRIKKGGSIKDPEVIAALEAFRLPVSDSTIEELIRTTLGIEGELKDRDLVWASLSALLCPLHQSVGSCFATAPAILVHQEQPLQFLRDLKDLLTTGRLSRTFGGNTYTVPINIFSKKSGHHPLLKTWEYTLASFVDVKSEFSSWNLYESLGLESAEKGGIGEVAHDFLTQKLEEANKVVAKCQVEYESAFDQLKTAESLLRGARNESDLRRIKAEHQGRAYHFEACEELRDKNQRRAEKIANYFPFFIEHIIQQFQNHFQEVYDPDLNKVEGDKYEDTPAGFRLLYKHGRTHVGSWTAIENSQEYIQALRQFFMAIEPSLIEDSDWREGKKEISLLITAIVHHLSTEEFISSAINRMKKGENDAPGREKKPWAYISGGTLTTLLQTYFCNEKPLSSESRWVDSPLDLLIFLIETMKKLPPKITNLYRDNPSRRMLMASPTHVFSFLPGQPLLVEGWEDPGFTYTWVRDRILLAKSKPLVFADSNWKGIYFSFVVSPETGELEFWRTDKQAQKGEPMEEWSHFLNGTHKQPWTIFTNPYDYTSR